MVLIVNVSDFQLENDGLVLVLKIAEVSTSLNFCTGEDSTLSTLSTPTQMLLHESMSYRSSSGILRHISFIGRIFLLSNVMVMLK